VRLAAWTATRPVVGARSVTRGRLRAVGGAVGGVVLVGAARSVARLVARARRRERSGASGGASGGARFLRAQAHTLNRGRGRAVRGGGRGQQAAQWVRGEGWGVAHLTTAEMSFAAHLDRSPKGVRVRESDRRHSPAGNRGAGCARPVSRCGCGCGRVKPVRTPRLGAADCAQAQESGHALRAQAHSVNRSTPKGRAGPGEGRSRARSRGGRGQGEGAAAHVKTAEMSLMVALICALPKGCVQPKASRTRRARERLGGESLEQPIALQKF
jgi:hypothetical protein